LYDFATSPEGVALRENMEAVRDAEWALFYSLVGSPVAEAGLGWLAAGGGWQRFLPEAAKRLDAAKLKYGGEGVLNMAKKVDVKQIDRIVREVGLSPAQREILHEEMRAPKGADGLGAFDDLLELAREVRTPFPGK
jgi:hypothetical protein